MTGVQASAGNLVKVTFVANNMTDGMIVDILYYCAEHGWEVVKRCESQRKPGSGVLPLSFSRDSGIFDL